MKIPRKALLIIIASLGMLIIAYSLFRHFTGIGLGEEEERLMMNIIVFTALGIFVYNRKLAKEEKQAKEVTENEKNKAEENLVDENLPHWERYKNDENSRDDKD